MAEMKQFKNSDELKMWLLQRKVPEAHATVAAPLLLGAGFDYPSSLLMAPSEALRDAGVPLPMALSIVFLLQGQPLVPKIPKTKETMDLYYAEVLQYLDEIAGHCPDCIYSAAEDFGGHLVAEFFPYQERKTETNKITASLEKRRTTTKKQTDKESNPLITIPGSPGTGKSTFFAHFGECNYVKGAKSIVCTLTFNMKMPVRGVRAEDIGLRVLFGGLRGMQCLKKHRQWLDFHGAFSEMEQKTPISVIDAVWLLRRLHGQRRVLILVDEISKVVATDEQDRILTALGAALDNDKETDVILSALAPHHVESLVSKSSRSILYAVLLPLTGNLGANETKAWVESLKLPSETTENRFKMNLLYSTHLLASGFPRALQRLCETMKAGELGEQQAVIQKNWLRGSERRLLFTLAQAVQAATRYGGGVPIDHETLELIMSSRPIGIGEKHAARCRSLIENNMVYVHSIESHQTIKIATFLFSLFKTSIFNPDQRGESVEATYPIVGAGHLLFRDTASISQYFERAIDWSIFSHGIYLPTPNSMFGVDTLDGVVFERTFRVVTKKAATTLADNASVEERFAAFGALEANAANIPPENNPGFDSAWRFEVKEGDYVFYVQAKVSKPRRSLLSAVAGAMKLTLQYHSTFHQEIPLERVFMLFYLWDDVESVPSKGQLLAEKVASVSAFVEQHYENIFIFDRKRLVTFLIPTLVPIPTLVNARQNVN